MLLVAVGRIFYHFFIAKKRVSSDVTSSLGGLKEIRTEGAGWGEGRPRRYHCISNEYRNIHNSQFKQVLVVR